MKFEDIKQYTGRGNYHNTVMLNYLKWQIKNWEKDQPVELCPDFQRGHIWNEEQQIRYVEHLLRGGISGRNIYWNSSSWMRNFDTPIQLVDGLQRVTACLKFLRNKIPVFGYFFKEFEDPKFLYSVNLDFYVNDLETRAEVLQWYIELNEGGVIHTPKEIDKVKKMLEQEKVKEDKNVLRFKVKTNRIIYS